MAKLPSQRSSQSQVTKFLQQAEKPNVQAKKVTGRLVFAIDATASRQPSWDRACHLQAQMFGAADTIGGLAVQLCYYRGYQEFYHSPWCYDSRALLNQMTQVHCLGGYTQIGKVLAHAIAEAKKDRINALVFIGDALEENIEDLCHLSGQLGVLQCPVFAFQEGFDPGVARAFQQIAQLSGGAYHAFDESSAKELSELLSAVAIYASGGAKALSDYAQLKSGTAKQLLQQLNK